MSTSNYNTCIIYPSNIRVIHVMARQWYIPYELISSSIRRIRVLQQRQQTPCSGDVSISCCIIHVYTRHRQLITNRRCSSRVLYHTILQYTPELRETFNTTFLISLQLYKRRMTVHSWCSKASNMETFRVVSFLFWYSIPSGRQENTDKTYLTT